MKIIIITNESTVDTVWMFQLRSWWSSTVLVHLFSSFFEQKRNKVLFFLKSEINNWIKRKKERHELACLTSVNDLAISSRRSAASVPLFFIGLPFFVVYCCNLSVIPWFFLFSLFLFGFHIIITILVFLGKKTRQRDLLREINPPPRLPVSLLSIRQGNSNQPVVDLVSTFLHVSSFFFFEISDCFNLRVLFKKKYIFLFHFFTSTVDFGRQLNMPSRPPSSSENRFWNVLEGGEEDCPTRMRKQNLLIWPSLAKGKGHEIAFNFPCITSQTICIIHHFSIQNSAFFFWHRLYFAIFFFSISLIIIQKIDNEHAISGHDFRLLRIEIVEWLELRFVSISGERDSTISPVIFLFSWDCFFSFNRKQTTVNSNNNNGGRNE